MSSYVSTSAPTVSIAKRVKKAAKKKAAKKKAAKKKGVQSPEIAAPKSLKVTGVTKSSVSVAWDSVAGATGYDIYRDGSYVASSKIPVWTSPDWPTGTYRVQVVATAPGVYSPKSSSADVTLTGTPTSPVPAPATSPAPAPATSPAPAPVPVPVPASSSPSAGVTSLNGPVGVTASDITDTRFTLTWDSVAGATGYDIYRDGSYMASSKIPVWTSPDWPTGTYRVQVVATAPGVYSPKSSSADVTLTGTPTSPAPAPAPAPAPIPTISTAPIVGTSSPSGEAMPVGDLPGWKQIWGEDFTRSASLGSFLSVYSDTMGAYPAGWKDTSGNGTYHPGRTLSAANGLMDLWVHTSNGAVNVSAPQPRLFGSSASAGQGQTYGRYSVRFRSDPVPGYKTAWLLWPDSDRWPADGEIDFPEGRLDSTISAYAHYASASGGQDAFELAKTYGSWHTATIEWTPDAVTFYLDGTKIGKSTKNVPSGPMHWVLQTETTLDGIVPNPSASGHVQIDWAVAYSYNP